MESRVHYAGKSVEMDLIRHSTRFEYYTKLPNVAEVRRLRPVLRVGTGTTPKLEAK
jgi:hypothetical protein